MIRQFTGTARHRQAFSSGYRCLAAQLQQLAAIGSLPCRSCKAKSLFYTRIIDALASEFSLKEVCCSLSLIRDLPLLPRRLPQPNRAPLNACYSGKFP